MPQRTGIEVAFLGAAGEVTGSCYRVETRRARFLVECGMFQGGRDADDKNAAALDFDVRSIDFVVITHAHIDHSGLLPRLAAHGYSGPVYATPATIDLLGVMLPDSAHIHEMEFARAHDVEPRHRPPRTRLPDRAGARGDPAAAPLYTVADAQRSLSLLVPVAYDRLFEPKASIRFRFRDA
ncbi:MAG: MBL fold metallo-hydrolase, partial [Betaproteobacteria bacterium]|nr:MBL fold metallo-hydrolase [Betaproteobacteria bacterium]